jgi:hypothetical protein
MVGTIPFELIGLVCTIACIVALSVALLTYVQRARQRKRGDPPAAVTRPSSDTPTKMGTYQRADEPPQEAAIPTAEKPLKAVEENLASPSSSSQQQPLRRPASESALPTFASGPPRFEKPVVGVPGRTLDPLNLADEIDQMVQHKLRERPDLAGRHIRLSSGLDGGLCIYVDDEVFEAVGDITDFRVRELIRDTIREWEGI